MPKHSNRTTTRGRSFRAPAPAAPSTSEFVCLAKRLTEWRAADDALDRAKTLSERSEGIHSNLVEHAHAELHPRTEALREYMAWVEPETIEDVAALTVLLYEAFDMFDDQFVDQRFGCEDFEPDAPQRPITEQDNYRYGRDKRMIQSMLRNMIGCLARHTKSTATGWETWETGIAVSFSEKLAVALAAAKRLESSPTTPTKSAANDVAA